MIKKPVLGKRVVVGVVECCGGGFIKGTVGEITEIASDDSFKVRVHKDQWWYCRKCVSPLKTAVATKTSLNSSYTSALREKVEHYFPGFMPNHVTRFIKSVQRLNASKAKHCA